MQVVKRHKLPLGWLQKGDVQHTIAEACGPGRSAAGHNR